MKRLLIILPLAILTACGNKEKKYDATGTFEATEVTVSAEGSGKLLRLDAEEGSQLTQGEEVGLIDTVQLWLTRRQLVVGKKVFDAQQPDIQKQIAVINQQIANGEKEKRRVELLLKAGAANTKQLDDINEQLMVFQRQLVAQTSLLHKNRGSLSEQSNSVSAQVAQVDDKLQRCHVTAPISGTVLAKYAEAGELATPGKALFKLADLKRMYLRAYLTSSQLAQVKLGQQVKVFADYGDSQKEYAGRITWISSQAEFTPKTILTADERTDQVYAIKVTIQNDGGAKVGMYGGIILN